MQDDRLREQIDLYVAGMLEEAERKEVERVIVDDPRAAAWLAESRRMWELCDDYRVETAPERIVNAAWQQVQGSRSRSRRWPAALAIAAAVMLSVTAYWYFEQARSPAVLDPRDREIVKNLDFFDRLDMLEQMDLVRQADLLQGLSDSGLGDFLEALAS